MPFSGCLEIYVEFFHSLFHFLTFYSERSHSSLCNDCIVIQFAYDRHLMYEITFLITFLSDEGLPVSVYGSVVRLCLSTQWFTLLYYLFTSLVSVCFPCKARFSLLGFEPQTVLRSGLLIINLDPEKVRAGSHGATVAMATLINILSVLIGWQVESGLQSCGGALL